jgi:hypothetical protein
VVSLFRRARFYNKLFTPLAEEQVAYTERAVACYSLVSAYCEANPDHGVACAQELDSSVQVCLARVAPLSPARWWTCCSAS